MQITIVVNGTKKKALKYAQDLGAQLEKAYTISTFATKYRGHARTLSFDAAFNCDVLICIGGDGTINECASGIAEAMSQKESDSSCMLLPAAFGTGNDFVRNFDIDTSSASVLKRLQNRNANPCDIFELQESQTNRHFFINECSAGLGPHVVRLADRLPSFIKGNIRFHLAIAEGFLSYRKKSICITTPDFSFKGPSMAIVCANGKFFGGGICIAPDAKTDDGVLNVTIIGKVGLLEYLRYLPALKRGKKIEHPEIHYLECTCAQINSSNLEADGEYIHKGQFNIKLLPYPIRLI